MNFNDQTEKQLIDRKLSIDCFKITLKQRTKSAPNKFSGPGCIYHDEVGNLRAKLYDSSTKSSDKNMLDLFFPSGKGLVPEGDYYDLQAKDSDGTLWLSQRVHIGGAFRTTPFGTVFNVKLSTIESKTITNAKISAYHGEILIRGKRDLPFNKFLPNSDGSSALRGMILKFDDTDYDFDQRSDSLFITMSSNCNRIDKSYSERFIEAIAIACGEQLDVVYIRTANKNHTFSSLFNTHAPGSTRLPALIPMIPYGTENFSAFLEMYTKNREEKHGKMFRYWERLTESTPYSETAALVVSINIEGMIKFYHNQSEILDPAVEEAINKAKKAVQLANFDEKIHNRIMQSLSDFNKMSISRKLRNLLTDGVISQLHITAWNKLRNSTAHADSLSSDEASFVNFLNNQSLCIDLFYSLICKEVGYLGSRYDLSTKLLPAPTPAWNDNGSEGKGDE